MYAGSSSSYGNYISKSYGRSSNYGATSGSSAALGGQRSTNDRSTGHYGSSSFNPVSAGYSKGVSSNLTKANSLEESKHRDNNSYLNTMKREREENKIGGGSYTSSLNNKTLSASSKTSVSVNSGSYNGYGIAKSSKPTQNNLMGGILSKDEESKVSLRRGGY